jgi:hypothetical protein
MRKALLLTLGGGVGYVLGARAGRPAYDRITTRWSDLASAVGISDVFQAVKDAGCDVRDSAVRRASDAVSTTADEATHRIDANSGDGGPSSSVVIPIGIQVGEASGGH